MTKNYNSSGDGFMLLETLRRDTEASRTWFGPPLGTFTRWMLFLSLLLFAGNGIYAQNVNVTATSGTASASYATVNAAFTAINAGTHKGAIVLTVVANTTEPATPVPLLKSAAPSSYTSISIVPSGNVTINSAAAPSTNRGVLEFAGADNVTINGDDAATLGTRNLSIVAATTTTAGIAVIRLSSNSATGTDGADNITIKNCIITGSRSSATSTVNNYGIQFSNGTSTSSVSTGAYSSINTIIDNNLITRCYYGVHAIGTSTTYLNTGLQVINNTIGSATASDYVGRCAINLSHLASTAGSSSAIIRGNDIRSGHTAGTASMGAIELATTCAGTLITRNNIHDCINTTSSVWGMYGIFITSATSNAGITITNNFIRDIQGYNTSTFASIYGGIGVYSAIGVTGLIINNNTFYQNASTAKGGAILLSSTSATVSQMMNNIFVNTINNTASYCVYFTAAANISGGTVNNNDYYVTGSGTTGYYNGTSYATLSAWKTATGKDANSQNELPTFTSATDLHIPAGTVTLLESGGASAATTGVSIDFDGDARPGPAGSVNGGGTSPDIGADEFDGKGLTCYPVASLSGVATAYNTANLTWTAPSTGTTPTSYEYAVTTSATPPASGTSVSATSVTGYSGLSGNTTYYLHVRSFCGGSDYSSWSTSAAFTTPCQPVVPTYTNDFTSFPGTCWNANLSGGTPATGPSGTTAVWVADGWLNSGTTGAARINLFTNTQTGWLRTIPVDLSAGGYRVKFNYAVTAFNAATAAATGATDDVVQFLVSTDGGTTWTALQTWNSPNSTISNSSNLFTYTLTGYTGANTVFAFYATDGTTDNTPDYDFIIDNFVVETAPSCGEVTGLTASATSHNTASASWTAPATGTPTGYEYAFSTSATPPASGTAVTGTSVTGAAVSPSTTYYVHVRTVCGGVYSAWVTYGTITTPCAPITSFPYVENFNSVTTPAMPSCWTVVDNNADTDKWITYGTYGTGGSNAAGLYTDGNGGANDDYLILPGVTLTGNQRLRFSVAARSSGEPNDYRVVMSTTNTSPSSFTTVLQPLTTVSSTAQTPTNWIDLSAYTGTVYIAIHVPSGGLDGWYLYVDDITIEDKPIVAIASGEFSDGANWQGGVAPSCSSSASIPSGINMTVTSGSSNVRALEILSGGSLSVSSGALTVAGCTGNNAALSNAGSLTVSGGTLNVNGYIANATGSTFSQSGGAINIDGNDNGATATSVASGIPLLGFGSSSASFATGTISLTGGTLTIVDPHTATTNTNAYAIYAFLSTGVSFNAGSAHTVSFGDGTSTQAGGNASGFYWTGFASSGRLNLGNVVVNNPSGTNRNVTQTGTNVINGDLTVTAGTYDQGTSVTNIGGNVSVSGTFVTGGTVAFGTTTGAGTIAQQSAAQSISVSGSGAIVNAATSATSNFNNIQFHNTSSAGVTINMLNNISGNTNVAANAVGTITFNGKATTAAGKALLMGTATALSGASVTVTSGGLTPGSTFARGWNTAQTGSSFTAGAVPGNNSMFPFIDGSGYNRQAWIERVTPSAAGILAVTYTDGAGTTDVSISDGAYTVDKRSQGKWTVSKLGTAEASATYKLAVSAVNVFGGTPSTANARITTAAGVLGTYQAGTNLPHAQRTGLTATDLTGQDFYIGIANSEVPFISIATGNWNEGTTWNKGTIPTSSDFATIASGHTVTVDGSYTAASANLTVNSGGTLAVSANTLALGTISNAGTVNVTGGALNTTTSVTNSGTFNVSGGSVTTTTSLTNSGTLNVSGGMVTTTTTLTNSSGANLNLSAGTLAVTTTYTNAGTFTGTGGTLNVTGGSTTGITNSGTFVVNGVTANLGTVANVNDRTFSSTGGTLTVTTGSLNVNGNMTVSAGAFNQAGGNINIDGNGSTNSVASGTYLLNITTSNVNWTGGTTTIVDPHASGSYAFYYSGSTASNMTTGTHTFRLGDGVSTTVGSTTYGFYLYTWGSSRFSFRNLEVNGGSAAGRFTYTLYGFGVNGDLTINANSEYRDAGTTTYVAGNVVNNGTYTNTGALYMGTYLSGTAGASSAAQTISGSGTWRNSTTTSTASMVGFTINNTNAAGVTLSVPLSVSGTLNLTAGKVVTTSSNLLTLGTATAAGTLSGGSTTAYIDGPFARTFAASRTASGTYSAATLFPVGKGSSYLPIYVDPSTSAGGAVGIKGEAFTSNSGTMGTSVTSLGTNRWEALPTSGAANLTNTFVRVGDASIVSTNKILQASSASGSYEALPLSTIYAAATPNTLTTQTAIDAASYLGYLSYGNLNSCAAPTAQATGFTVAALTTTTVTASYTAATGGASHYLVVAYPTGSTPTAPADYASPTAASLGTGAIILYNGTALTFTGSGLTANTGYDVYVYSYNNSGCYGPVFNTTAPLTSTFTTCAAATGAPGTPTVSSLSDTTLNVAWTASSTSGVDYILEVATNSSFTSYVSGYNNVNVGTALTANLTGLTANTPYYIRVRAALGSCYSTNTAYLTTATICSTVTTFTQNFDASTSLPSCWVKVGSTGTANIQASSSQSSPNCLYMYSSSSSSRAVVSMPPVSNAGANTHWLKFSYRANFTAGETIEVGYLTNPSDASTFVAVTSLTTSALTYVSTTVDLGTAPGANTVLAFRTGTLSYSVLIDDVIWEAKPTCYVPTDLTATSVTTTGATISWSAPTTSTPTEYDYEVRLSGAAGSGASGLVASGTVTAPATSQAVTGLTSGTSYSVYVRSHCGGSDYSSWSSAYILNTVCTAYTTLPHSESFDSASLPICWSTGGTGTWAPDDANDSASASHSGARFAGLAWTGDSDLDALLVSPMYNLTSDPRSARVSVWIYRGSNGLTTDRLYFYANTTASLTGATQLLDIPLLYTSSPAETASGWYKYTVNVPDSYVTGGNFYIIARGTLTTSFSSYSNAFDDYTLEYRPTSITSFNPGTVCSQDSQTVTITGLNFNSASAVKFNGVDAASYSVVNNTTITAVTPVGVTAGNITVTTPLNTATSTTSLAVTNNPTVADITGGGGTICTGTSVLLSNATLGGSWSSSNDAVATVDASGNVTGVSAGTVTINYIVTDSGCSTTKSTSVTVNQAPAIASYTLSQTVTPGGDASYTVSASGTGITYQWELSTNGGTSFAPLSDGAQYSGVNTATLSITGIDFSMNGYRYRVVVTGTSPCGSVTSSSLGSLLNVSNVGIATHPLDVTLCSDGSGLAQFNVTGTGAGLTYVWYEKTGSEWTAVSNGTTSGVTYSGQGTASLSLSGLSVSNNGWQYFVEITDETLAQANSNPAILTVNQAVSIGTQPSNGTVCSTGGVTNFTVAATGTGLAYQWQYSTSASGPWSNVVNATPAGVTYSTASPSTLAVTTPGGMAAGTYYYRVVVSGTSPCTAVNSSVASLTINAPSISTQPSATAIVAAGTASMSVVTSAPSATYQWQYSANGSTGWASVTNGTPSAMTYTGATTATLSFAAGSSVAAGTGYYRVVVTSNGCTVTSNNAMLTISTYCSIPTATSASSYLNDFTTTTGISNINNLSTGFTTGGYADFTSQIVSQAQGSSISFNTALVGTTVGVAIWVDWNQDGVFTNSSERMYNSANYVSTASGSFTVPMTALPGNTRMRVSIDYNATSPASCPSSGGRREVEDYTFNVIQLSTPLITDITPANYCSTTGVITISGSNFYGSSLTIGGTPITPITINPAGTQITATVNAGVSGTVVVANAAGSATGSSFAVTAPPALTLSASTATICSGGSSSVVSVTAGQSDYDTFNWLPTSGVSGTAATGFTFNPSVSTTYTLTASNASGCTRTATMVVTVNSITDVSVTAASTSVCNGQVSQLTASGGTAGAQATVGTGTTTNTSDTSSSAYPVPYGAYYENSKQQYLIRASELTALGLSAGSTIKNITFDVTTLNSAGVHKSYTVSIGNTSQSAIATWESGLTTVFGPVDYQPVAGANTHVFSTNFVWNGSSNIIVQVCHSNDTTSGGTNFTSNTLSKFTATAFNSSLVYRLDNVDACSGSTITYTQAKRPNMVFGYDAAPAYVWSPTTGLYTDSGATTPYTGGSASVVYAKPAVATTYTVVGTHANGCSDLDSVTISIGDKTWTGTAGTSWNVAGNWCGNQVPTATDNVVIPAVANQPVVSGSITALASSIIVATGATLTVQSGNVLNVTNGVAASGTVTLDNNAHLVQGSAVTTNPNTGSIVVKRNSTPLYRQDYTAWSSPVASQNLLAFSPNTLEARFYTFNTASNAFAAVAPATNSFQLGRGYLIRMPNGAFGANGTTPTGTFTTTAAAYQGGSSTMTFNGQFAGVPNSGNVAVALSTAGTAPNDGFNLVGNPYPSPISIPAFFAANTDNINGYIWVWRKKNSESVSSAYCTVNSEGEFVTNHQEGATDPNGIIQTGQGFIVKAVSGGNLVFNNAMRSTSTNNDASFFRMSNAATPQTVESHRFWLNLSDATHPVAQMMVGYKSNATMGVDPMIDAPFINDAQTGLNSIIDAVPYTIQGRSLPFNVTDEVPLHFKAAAAGNFTIALDHMDGLFLEGQDIFLKDNVTGTIHDIKAGSYTFTSAAGTFTSRFSVIYQNTALGTDNPVLDANSIVIYKNDGKLHINTGVATMKNVTIFDIRGRLVYSKDNVNASSLVITDLHVEEQMLIVKVTTTDNATASKKVVY